MNYKTAYTFFLFFVLTGNINSQSAWNSQLSGTGNNLNKVYYKSSISGNALFIVGDNGTILRSTNLGVNWIPVQSNTNSDLNSIVFNYQDTGFVVGSGGIILRSTNAGLSWNQLQSLTTNNLNDVKMSARDSIRVGICGSNGTLIRMVNGNWVLSVVDSVDLNSISIYPYNNFVLMVGDYGAYLKSTNNGLNWNRIYTGTSNNLNYITEHNLTHHIVGDNGTAFWMQGPNSPNIINTFTNRNLNSIYVDNNYYFLTCGNRSLILKNWNPQFINRTTNLNSILNIDENNAWAVGDSGLILYSNTITVNFVKTMDANRIRCWFTNDGTFNYQPGIGAGFEWPKNENKFARYASGPILGAIVDGDTLVTVCVYDSEFLPGQTINGIPTGNGSLDFRNYRLIYDVNDSNRLYWPNALLGNSDQGAPVYFDPLLISWKPSDYGNQTMFYSYTDSYDNSHTVYGGRTSPLKADIKQINFCFNQPEELRDIIYQEYRVINRSSSVWNECYINLFTDDDVGTVSNDRAGVDTNHRLSFTYNGSPNDGEYGSNPPAVGFAVIRAPVTYTGNNNDTVEYYSGKSKRIRVGYKQTHLNSTVVFHDDTNLPTNYQETYYSIRGLMTNGSNFINPVTSQPTKFVYSGDPVTGGGWNCASSDNMIFYQGFGPMTINPGDTQIVVIAQVIARGGNHLNSITKLREATVIANQYYDNNFEGVVIGLNNFAESASEAFELSQNYPNPFNPVTNIEYTLNTAGFVKLVVYDAVGREMQTLVNERQTTGKYSVKFDGKNLSSGIYFYTFEVFNDETGVISNHKQTKRMILLK